MFEVAPLELPIGHLFAVHRHLVTVRDAVLEGRLGRAFVDRRETPTAARLDLGCYALFGGDPGAARDLVASVAAPIELIQPDLAQADGAWRRYFLDQYGHRLQDRPMEAFSGASLEPNALRRLADRLPAAYRLAPLDAHTAAGLDGSLEPHGLQTFPAPEALARDGMAWGVFPIGERETSVPVSVASSYAISSQHVEVAISTRVEHRGRGLAAAVAARFCLDALERGLEPCWHAANPVSIRLARRLGFEPAGTCAVLYLSADG
ncbi:MAG: GNAT family N-acetyltransferase [Acidobacteriota bacterium]